MLNMINVDLENGPFWAPIRPQTFNIFYISPVLSTFWNNPLNTFIIFNISPVWGIFTKTFNIFPVSWPQVHETGEMLNVFVEMCLKQGKC